MSDLTRQEQEAGAAKIKAWPKTEVQFVVKLPPVERDVVVLLAALLDARPA